MRKSRKLTIAILGISLLIVLAIVILTQFKTPSSLLFAAVSHRLPNSSHLRRIRDDLLKQERFVEMLAAHERGTLRRFGESGEKSWEKLHIYNTSTAMLGIRGFHDKWETWVRTDIFEGRPLTSFLVRLGVIRDENAEVFFSNQCESAICRVVMKSIVVAYNKMFDWGAFKGFRLNITESDETSSVSGEMLQKEKWSATVERTHARGRGLTFSSHPED